MVVPSTYSRSLPTGMPRAKRVTAQLVRAQKALQVHGSGFALNAGVGRQDDLHRPGPPRLRSGSANPRYSACPVQLRRAGRAGPQGRETAPCNGRPAQWRQPRTLLPRHRLQPCPGRDHCTPSTASHRSNCHRPDTDECAPRPSPAPGKAANVLLLLDQVVGESQRRLVTDPREPSQLPRKIFYRRHAAPGSRVRPPSMLTRGLSTDC